MQLLPLLKLILNFSQDSNSPNLTAVFMICSSVIGIKIRSQFCTRQIFGCNGQFRVITSGLQL